MANGLDDQMLGVDARTVVAKVRHLPALLRRL